MNEAYAQLTMQKASIEQSKQETESRLTENMSELERTNMQLQQVFTSKLQDSHKILQYFFSDSFYSRNITSHVCQIARPFAAQRN
jgi:hypothetical protein